MTIAPPEAPPAPTPPVVLSAAAAAAAAAAAPPRTDRARRALLRKTATTGMLTLAGFAAWTLLYLFPLSALQEQHTQAQLYAQMRSQLGKETAPLGGAIKVGTPVAVISAPRAHIDHVVVVEGTAAAQTTAGPGHVRTSVLPGQQGYSVLEGRSLAFGAPFRDIGSLRAGDPITVVTQQGQFTYAVDDVRRPGEAIPAPPSSTQSRLVLISSEGRGSLGGFVPDRVLYVDATLSDNVQPAQSGATGTLPSREQPMHADTRRLPLDVLALQLLILAIVGVAWLELRWGRVRAYLLGAPVLLAALWFLSQTAAELLPNVL